MVQLPPPLRIALDPGPGSPLTAAELRYTFTTLLTIAGYPWEFVGPDAVAPDICYGSRPAAVQVVPARVPRARLDREPEVQSCADTACLVYEETTGPACTTVDGQRRFNCDIILAAFCLLTGREERLLPRNRFGFHDVTRSVLYRHNLLLAAPVDRYAALLTEPFQAARPAVPRWPNGKRLALALTHDVDYPEIRPRLETLRLLWQRRGRVPADTLRGLLSGRESFWQFDAWLALEAEYGVPSAFYFCALAGTLLRYLLVAPDPFYDISRPQFRAVLARIEDAGGEIGLHASYTSYRDPARFIGEKQHVERIIGARIAGNRHHYWHLDQANLAATAGLFDRAGLQYDASLAFERCSGFRRGTAMPFHLFNVETQRSAVCLELPTVLMDAHLFHYAELSRHAGRDEELAAIVAGTAGAGGVLVADYHQRVLNRTCYPGWGDSCRRLLDLTATRSDCWCALPRDITQHWLDRERRLCEHSGEVRA